MRIDLRLNFLPEQSVTVAVGIQESVSLLPETDGDILFRVQFDNFGGAGGDIGEEGDVVGFGHGMIHGHIVFVVHGLQDEKMVIIADFRFLFRQGDTAAGEGATPHGGNEVAADRADVEVEFLHIAGCVFVFGKVPRQ